MSPISGEESTFWKIIGRYTKMLLQALPGTDTLSFDGVVPKAPKASSTETRRVAAAAFYHCLGECLRARQAVES